MSLQAVLPIWQTVQGRFQKSVQSLTEKNLHLQLGSAAIGPMLLHNAEVEYMFADWFFGAAIPAEIQAGMDARAAKGYAFDFSLEELIAYLQASSQHLIAAMKALPEQRRRR